MKAEARTAIAPRSPSNEPTAEELAADAAQRLVDAFAALQDGDRDRHRQRLEQAMALANRAVAAAEHVADTASLIAASSTLVAAHASFAEDALHGTGQLSLASQRAPTADACDDGWRRSAIIAAGAAESARVAAEIAERLRSMTSRRPAIARAAEKCVRRAERAAQEAQRIIEGRNLAFTFHTDSGFSFGEGWYVAAAALLTGTPIQIEPGKAGTAQAERFVRDAGLADRLQPFRSRARAVKQTTEIVARAFRADPASAQRRLRESFLRDSAIPSAIADWIAQRISERTGRKKVLVWVREAIHDVHRNSTVEELGALCNCALRIGVVPVLVGDAVKGGGIPDGALDLTLFWKDPLFRQEDTRRAQLQFFEALRGSHGVVGQVGVTTAGMDGPALMGMPTMYLTDETNVRMREWVGAVPGYRELVRDADYLDRVTTVFEEWASD